MKTFTYLDFHKIDRLQHSRLSCQSCSIQYSSGRWDNLTTSTMDSISMKGNIMDVESTASHIFFTQYTLYKNSNWKACSLTCIMHMNTLSGYHTETNFQIVPDDTTSCQFFESLHCISVIHPQNLDQISQDV